MRTVEAIKVGVDMFANKDGQRSLEFFDSIKVSGNVRFVDLFCPYFADWALARFLHLG